MSAWWWKSHKGAVADVSCYCSGVPNHASLEQTLKLRRRATNLRLIKSLTNWPRPRSTITTAARTVQKRKMHPSARSAQVVATQLRNWTRTASRSRASPVKHAVGVLPPATRHRPCSLSPTCPSRSTTKVCKPSLTVTRSRLPES